MKNKEIKLNILRYAREQLRTIEQENDVKFHVVNDTYIIVQLASGKNLKLSDEEVLYQATEYLRRIFEN